eukprot:scaffold322208_cov28-Tisochrysis_lutea.AAC.2
MAVSNQEAKVRNESIPSSPSLRGVNVASNERPHFRHEQPTEIEGSSPGSCRRISVRSAARSLSPSSHYRSRQSGSCAPDERRELILPSVSILPRALEQAISSISPPIRASARARASHGRCTRHAAGRAHAAKRGLCGDSRPAEREGVLKAARTAQDG